MFLRSSVVQWCACKWCPAKEFLALFDTEQIDLTCQGEQPFNTRQDSIQVFDTSWIYLKGNNNVFHALFEGKNRALLNSKDEFPKFLV